MKLYRVALTGLIVFVGGELATAATTPWLTDGLDFSAFTEKVDDGVDTPDDDYGVENVVAPTVFDSGDAARIWDLSSNDKPELQGETASPLTEGFQIDFQSQILSVIESSRAIRFRMANSGKSITSENRSAFSVSWQNDGEITAKYENALGERKTLSSEPQLGLTSVSLVINPSNTDTFDYDSPTGVRTLNASSYDVYINNSLFNRAADFSGGLLFHDTASSDFDAALNLQRFGFTGSSNSDRGPDFLFDNVFFKTGDDVGVVPEPATATLVLMMGGLLAASRSRRS